MYIRGFAGVNNHDVALYMIRSWDLHLLDLQRVKTGCSIFTPVYHLMIMIEGNSGRSMIVWQLFKNCSNASIKIAELELFLKSTCALLKSFIPQEMKLVSSSKIRKRSLNMIYFLSLRMQSLTLLCTL